MSRFETTGFATREVVCRLSFQACSGRLAVSSGVDILTQWRLPRGLSAALIVICFFAALFGFGAWMAPTLHSQGIELRRRLPAQPQKRVLHHVAGRIRIAG